MFDAAFIRYISIGFSSASRSQDTRASQPIQPNHGMVRNDATTCAALPPTASNANGCLCVGALSAADLRPRRALAGLRHSQKRSQGSPPARSPRPPRAPCAAGGGASVVVRDLVLFLLTLLLLLLVGPRLLVIVVVPVVHDLAVALAVVGCRDDLVLAYDDCARGRVRAGSLAGARACVRASWVRGRRGCGWPA